MTAAKPPFQVRYYGESLGKNLWCIVSGPDERLVQSVDDRCGKNWYEDESEAQAIADALTRGKSRATIGGEV